MEVAEQVRAVQWLEPSHSAHGSVNCCGMLSFTSYNLKGESGQNSCKEQEARDLEASPITEMAQLHHHDNGLLHASGHACETSVAIMK
jgi:hypothetical protein